MKYLYIIIPALFFIAFLPPTADAAVSGKCSVEPSKELVPGQEVFWRVEPSGGSAVYEYEWSGSEGLSGHQRNTSITYRTEGSKWAEVTIISGDERAIVGCPHVSVEYPPLRGSCNVSTTASNERIRTQWGADVVGGDGAYTYSWSGSDGLSSNQTSVSKTYTTTGEKRVQVRISSNNETVSLDCRTDIPELKDLEENPITFGCDVQSGLYATERDITWYGIYNSPRGNWEDGFSYRWDLEDGRTYGKRVSIEYRDPGYVSGTLTTSEELRSDLLSTQSQCQAYIVDEDILPGVEVNYERLERPRDDRRRSTSDLFARNVAKYQRRAQEGPNGGCFIATAAYGSILEPEVATLRIFRDRHMETNAIGRGLVDVYYTASPSLASIIEKSDVLRFYSRIALSPIVAVVHILN
ncbi:MAG: PKD domain-containing protein [Candidatus Paceibacterota bacterium]